MQKEELINTVNEVVFNDEKYTQYYVSKFGINQGNFNNYRNGKRNIEGMQLKTVLKLIDVYNSKQ
ncbi:hypothetical protein [Apilactobacillus nanyangensis]|uniref:hypothetical protein n=1 Tax=Apilactobacillus nanyangensis TaxID=2799579 RepID=UPI00194528E1|nr:hypothetical protein [Apilactobacillus nanyangensis]